MAAEHEFSVLAAARDNGCSHVPDLWGVGVRGDTLSPCLVMSSMGESLEALHENTNTMRDKKRALLEGLEPVELLFQMLLPVYEVHALGYAHLDVTPSNLAAKLVHLGDSSSKRVKRSSADQSLQIAHQDSPVSASAGSLNKEGQEQQQQHMSVHISLVDFGSSCCLSSITPGFTLDQAVSKFFCAPELLGMASKRPVHMSDANMLKAADIWGLAASFVRVATGESKLRCDKVFAKMHEPLCRSSLKAVWSWTDCR